MHRRMLLESTIILTYNKVCLFSAKKYFSAKLKFQRTPNLKTLKPYIMTKILLCQLAYSRHSRFWRWEAKETIKREKKLSVNWAVASCAEVFIVVFIFFILCLLRKWKFISLLWNKLKPTMKIITSGIEHHHLKLFLREIYYWKLM